MEVNVAEMIGMIHRCFLDHDSQAWRISAASLSKEWRPPRQGCLNCTVDVAIRDRVAVLATSFRNSRASLYHLNTEQFSNINFLLGESSVLVAATNLRRIARTYSAQEDEPKILPLEHLYLPSALSREIELTFFCCIANGKK